MMAQHFSIGMATAPECSECANLLVTQLPEHHVLVTADELISVLERVVSDARHGFLLAARADGRIIGVAYAATLLSAEHCGFVSSLEELYVAPDWRQKGVGSALLSAIFDQARNHGIVAIELEV